MLYLSDEIIYLLFCNIDNIICFKNLMLVNSQYYEISKFFNKKKEYLLLKYYISNNTYNNYLKFTNYLNVYNDININLLLEHCLDNYKNNSICYNNLKYYDLNYIFELILKGGKINKKINKNIKIFYNRICKNIKYDKHKKINRFFTLINNKHDDLLIYSLDKVLKL